MIEGLRFIFGPAADIRPALPPNLGELFPRLNQHWNDATWATFIMEQDEPVAGALLTLPDGAVSITFMEVALDCRDRKLGSLLVRHIFEIAATRQDNTRILTNGFTAEGEERLISVFTRLEQDYPRVTIAYTPWD